MRGREILEEIDFLRSQGENRHGILEALKASSVQTASLQRLLARHDRADLHEFLFKREEAETPIPEHGDSARYNRGCRCELCKIANADRHAKFRRAKAAEEKDPDDPRHGKSTFYVNHGCRCVRCKDAHNKKMTAYYRSKKAS